MATAPPFTAVADYATVLAQLVPDTKTSRSDADLVLDGLEKYGERFPCFEQRDIGDGSTTAWNLEASPFAFAAASGATPALGFVRGFSDRWPIRVEELASAGVSQEPPVFLVEGRDFRIEERTVSNAALLYLVFDAAPATSLARVHIRKRWSHLQVPLHHQMAVVHAAGALKCEALASKLRSTVDSVGGSDIFDGSEAADAYVREAKDFWAKFNRTLGLGGADVPSVDHARARTGRMHVFARGTPS